MGLFERTREIIRARLRSFVLGPGAIEPSELYFGMTGEEWQPSEYGEYLATSNPVYFCSTLRAQLLTRLPLRLYRNEQEVTSGHLYDLLKKVNPFWTWGRLLRMTELSLCLWGEAYWFIERGRSGLGTPREIWWGRPDRVVVIPHQEDYVKEFLYRPASGSKDLAFNPSEVVWFQYDNPVDEFEGLAPLAATRLAADTRSAAVKSNYNLFNQGMQMGGAIMPRNGVMFTEAQATELEKKLDQRFRGVDKAHKWGVFRMEVQMAQAGVTPKDAEFLGLLQMTLEDACRAYKVPLDIAGGQRNYENYRTALMAVWELCVVPEAAFIAEELVEKLLPMAPGEADYAAFDTSHVAVLHEDETARWGRAREQIAAGAITVNEWRTGQGLEPVGWGDTWWAPLNLVPVDGSQATAEPGQGEVRGHLRAGRRSAVPAYDSEEHRILARRYERRVTVQERQVAEAVEELFRRQRDSLVDKLKAVTLPSPPAALSEERGQGRQGNGEELLAEIYDRPRWTLEFRQTIRPVLAGIVALFGQEALDELGVDQTFYETMPNVLRFLEQRAQRFAEEVNETTWDALKRSLDEGLQAGEGIPALQQRVLDVMGDRIRSSAETIARTETVGASNGGIIEAWRQSGVVQEKEWVSALIPGRTRDSHVRAHGQRVPLDGDFEVGAGRGPAPGQIGLAEEDINCLCTVYAVISEE